MIKNVSVIGAGTMGNGIAHVFAQQGFMVSLMDLSPQQLEKAMQVIDRNMDRQVSKGILSQDQKLAAAGNITTTTDLERSVSDAHLVVEAAIEEETQKLKIFKQLDQAAPQDCILATNTSSISITLIAAATARPKQVIGMHFMNPVPVMKLVEVINGFSTDPYVTGTIMELAKKLGKIPALANDYPGFVANRILMPMINEGVCALHEGVAGVEAIDTIMKTGMGHPMGPLQLADFIGLDVCLSILQVLQRGFGNPRYAPSPLLVNMVNSGRLGVKSGEGFYVYTTGIRELQVSDKFR